MTKKRLPMNAKVALLLNGKWGLISLGLLIFGMIMVPVSAPYWTWESCVYAILSLTVIRMLPVGLSLIGKNISLKDKGFIGWFGPRGIASVIYLEIVIKDLGFDGMESMMAVIVLTILLSVFLHGLTAVPFASTYPLHPKKEEDSLIEDA